MSDNVVVLNADYTFLSVTSWKNAVCLLIEGKAETLKETTRVVRNQSRTIEVTIPLYIRIIKYVRKHFKQKVNYASKNVFARDDQTCQYCGTYIEDVTNCTIDHVIPRAQGGKSKWNNCVTSCKPCNHHKADRTPSQAKMFLKRQPVRPTIGEFVQYYTKKHKVDELLASL
jgi:5-methylcytosine-specific restriction endonuclease McrA